MITRPSEASPAVNPAQPVDLIGNVLESSTEYSIIGKDLDGNILLWNEGARRLYGYEPEEVIGKVNASILYTPEDVKAGKPREMLAAALRDGQWEGNVSRVRKSGQQFTARVVVTPRRGPQGKAIGFLLISKDISAEVEASKALQASEARYRRLFEAAKDGILILDAETGTVVDVNPYLVELLGFAREIFLGKKIWELSFFKDIIANQDHFVELQQDEYICYEDKSLKTADGRRVVVEFVSTVYLVNDQRVIHCNIRNITKRKRAEEAVRKSEERFRTIFEQAPAGVAMVDSLTRRISEVNSQFAEIVGRTRAEMAALDWMSITHPDDVQEDLDKMALLNAQKIPGFNMNKRYRRPDGSYVWINMTIAPMTTADKSHPQHLCMIEDITERKQAEETLRESNRQLDQALEKLKATQQQMVSQERLHALGQMASGIAHDFNNALAPILGFSELLLLRPEKARDPKTLANFLQMINTSAKDATHVVRRLREFYRHRERGEVFLPVNLNNLILQTVALTQPRWKEQMQATGINIDVQSDLNDVPYIYCDESELREMLTNLIFNAVDALPTGGTITVRTRAEGDRVVLELSDSGTGMTAEVRRRCLEPFFSTKGERGTGLGLAMVYGVVKRHEGTLDIRSELGKGTTFVIRFPVESVPQLPLADPAVKTATRPLHILVVDDERMVLDVLTDYLAGDGHSVATATGGDQALAKFERAKFDLVITDRSMPDGNGEQLAAAIKARQPGFPVIMLTGFGGIMDATGDCPKGVDCLLSKPITLTEIRNALVQVCPAQSNSAAEKKTRS